MYVCMYVGTFHDHDQPAHLRVKEELKHVPSGQGGHLLLPDNHLFFLSNVCLYVCMYVCMYFRYFDQRVCGPRAEVCIHILHYVYIHTYIHTYTTYMLQCVHLTFKNHIYVIHTNIHAYIHSCTNTHITYRYAYILG